MSDIRNQLQTLQGSEITAAQLSTVGGKVFTNAEDAQADLSALIKWWRAIHAPTYGVVIPGSGTTKSGAGDGPVLSPGANESAHVVALSIENADAANPATVTFDVSGAIMARATVDPLGTAVIVGAGGQSVPSLDLANGHALNMSVEGVVPTDVSFTIAYSLLVQG